jgi:hypothetical protein
MEDATIRISPSEKISDNTGSYRSIILLPFCSVLLEISASSSKFPPPSNRSVAIPTTTLNSSAFRAPRVSRSAISTTNERKLSQLTKKIQRLFFYKIILLISEYKNNILVGKKIGKKNSKTLFFTNTFYE